MEITFSYDSDVLSHVHAKVCVAGDITYDFEMQGVSGEGPCRTILDLLSAEAAKPQAVAINVQLPGIDVPYDVCDVAPKADEK